MRAQHLQLLGTQHHVGGLAMEEAQQRAAFVFGMAALGSEVGAQFGL